LRECRALRSLRSLLKIPTNLPEPKNFASKDLQDLGGRNWPYDAENFEKLQNRLKTAVNDAGKGRQLAGGADSEEFAHQEANVERNDPAEIAFVDVFAASQVRASEASGIENMRKTAFDVFASSAEQCLAALAFYGAGGFPDGGAFFGF
jgi:hypothetical protein